MKIIIKKNEIRTIFNLPEHCEIELESESLAQAVLDPLVNSKTITITFPELSAKEIVEAVNNKVGDGKLLYGEWYHKEKFYTTEKTRPGTRTINLELLHTGKSFNDIKDMEDNMLNFAEVTYLLRESAEFRALLSYESGKSAWWTWTSSRDSDGSLVYVGYFDDDGAGVGRDSPGRRNDGLGVSFSRSE